MKTNQLVWQVLVIALFIILGCSFKGTAQTVQSVTLYVPTSNTNGDAVDLPVQTNQIVSLVGYDWTIHPSLLGNLPDGTIIDLTPFGSQYFGSTTTMVSSQLPQIVSGLTNITLTPHYTPVVGGVGKYDGWATVQITTPSSVNVISNYVPADAIVIPASATGNVQIILESSPDLANWTAASPGTYGASSATNRFFRVRAVHN